MTSRFVTVFLLACVVCCHVTCIAFSDWHFSGPNVAYHKTAYQKPGPHVDKFPPYRYTASLAVDGNEDTNFHHGRCSQTKATQYGIPSQHIAQWVADLGGSFSVTGIIIVNRKDLKVRLKDFVIFGFSKTFCSHTDNWCLIYNDTNLNMYREDRIYITDDTKQSYSQIAINLPKHSGDPDKGLSYLTLCEVKVYAAPRPSCNITGGFEISHVDIYNNSGTLINGSYTDGTVIQIICKDDFLIDGPKFIKCLSNGLWNASLPVCKVACKHMDIINGYLHPNQALYEINTNVTIACYTGYQPDRKDITCLNTGHWNSYSQCTQVQCDYPGFPENGYYMIGMSSNNITYVPLTSLPFDSTITGKCDDGYESKGNDIRHCQGNKTWSGQAPVCKKKQCPYPRPIYNGIYRFQNGSLYSSGSSSYKSTIYIICYKGYVLNGSKELICSSDKTWDRISKCQRVTCAFPELPNNGVYATKYINGTLRPYSGGPSYYLDIIHILCQARYILNSSSEIRQCLETGSWSGEPGKCVSVTCKRLKEPEGGFYNYTNTPLSDEFPYDTRAIAHCNDTFKISNGLQTSRRCTGKGIWDKEQVLCISTASQSKGEKTVVTIVGASVATVVILSATTAVTITMCRRKQRQQREEREQNLYMDLSCERRNLEAEYTDSLELQIPNDFRATERASSQGEGAYSTVAEEGPFYCNIVLK